MVTSGQVCCPEEPRSENTTKVPGGLRESFLHDFHEYETSPPRRKKGSETASYASTGAIPEIPSGSPLDAPSPPGMSLFSARW